MAVLTYYFSCQSVYFRDAVYLVAEKLDTDGVFSVIGREYLDNIASYPELCSGEVYVTFDGVNVSGGVTVIDREVPVVGSM